MISKLKMVEFHQQIKVKIIKILLKKIHKIKIKSFKIKVKTLSKEIKA